jgi:hypothetical protein
MKIEVYQDELYIALAAEFKPGCYGRVLDVPDEWAERYFQARREFDKLTDELTDLWSAAVEAGISRRRNEGRHD